MPYAEKHLCIFNLFLLDALRESHNPYSMDEETREQIDNIRDRI
jgi:hypothetical protein